MTSERGHGVVDVLAAVAIIGIALAGVFAVPPVVQSALDEGRLRSRATFLAEQALEEVRNAAWTATPSRDCLGVSAPGAAPVSETCDRRPGCEVGTACTTFPDEPRTGDGGHMRTVRVTDCGLAPGCGLGSTVLHPDLRLVQVTVTYGRPPSAPSAARAVTLDLLVARQ